MKRKQKNLLIYLGVGFLLVAIAVYNLWSYNAGYCTISSLMLLSMPAKLLLFGIVLAIVALTAQRVKKRKLKHSHYCRCGQCLLPNWSYCPVCGNQRRD